MSTVLERKDYLTKSEVRWCVGCGDYGALKAFTNALAKMQLPREKVVMVSGIGCSSRFPYYTETYGFHTIHGRAPVVAMGVKMTNPELSVWVVTGDGDALSIGGNHFIHLMRRNPDINLMLLNNRVYGLTKGQISPTSVKGMITKSSPYGSVDTPINPMKLAIACGATFAARVSDTDSAGMTEIFIAAEKHKGVSFIEVLQDCNIFNANAWEHVTKKSNRAANTIMLKHGEPLIYGEDKDKGFIVEGLDLKPVNINDVDHSKLLVHDAKCEDATLALKLSSLEFPESPYPFGIFRQVEAPVFEEELNKLDHDTRERLGKGTIHGLLNSGETWVTT